MKSLLTAATLALAVGLCSSAPVDAAGVAGSAVDSLGKAGNSAVETAGYRGHRRHYKPYVYLGFGHRPRYHGYSYYTPRYYSYGSPYYRSYSYSYPQHYRRW